MDALITLEHAKRQCRIPPDQAEYDAELEDYAVQATAIVIDYIKRPDHGWVLSPSPETGSPVEASPENDPDFIIVQAAIMKVCANLFFHKGDANGTGPITNDLVMLLERLRDPAVA